jgi:aldehyde dehydrogenase (NAD+)
MPSAPRTCRGDQPRNGRADRDVARQPDTSGTWHIDNFITAFKDFEFFRPLGPHAPNDRIAMEPIGVAGLITPWNWPMNQVTLKAFRRC